MAVRWHEAVPGGPGKVMLWGPSGSGKTKTALLIMSALVGPGGRIGVIDTEGGKSQKFAHEFSFTIIEPEDFSPSTYQSLMAEAARMFDGLLIDSTSHAWMGKGGVLDIKGRAATQIRGNEFAAWQVATPEHQRLIEAIWRFPKHLVCTARSKPHWDVVDKKPINLGLGPDQREGLEYEFDIAGHMDRKHTLTVIKSDCSELDGAELPRPGRELGERIKRWLETGEGLTEAEDLRRRIRFRASAGGDAMFPVWQEAIDMAKDNTAALQIILGKLGG